MKYFLATLLFLIAAALLIAGFTAPSREMADKQSRDRDNLATDIRVAQRDAQNAATQSSSDYANHITRTIPRDELPGAQIKPLLRDLERGLEDLQYRQTAQLTATIQICAGSLVIAAACLILALHGKPPPITVSN